MSAKRDKFERILGSPDFKDLFERSLLKPSYDSNEDTARTDAEMLRSLTKTQRTRMFEAVAKIMDRPETMGSAEEINDTSRSSRRRPDGKTSEQATTLRKLLKIPLTVSTLILPDRKASEGRLIQSTTAIWQEIVHRLRSNWSLAYELPPDKWEELVATAFHKDGFDEVVLTPRSGDHGRDVIAIKRGRGAIKVIGSVKAYKPGHLVKHDDVRALLHVMNAERDTSKAILTTTSDFAPRIAADPFVAPYLPTRLSLMNGDALRDWFLELGVKK